MKIGEAILKDIKDTFNSSEFNKTLDDIGAVYSDSIEEMNSQSKGPNGRERFSLNERYAQEKVNLGRRPEPDFYYSGEAYESFTYETKKKSIGFGYEKSEVASYMKNHEQGTTKLPQRRQFPIDKDSNSSEQKMNIKDTENLISKLLNSKRVLKAEFILN
jgi:hypothetical protein